MSGEQPTGQDAPVVIDEATPPAAATEQTAATTTTQTDGGEGGEKGPAPRTFTQAELDEIVMREKAKAAAKAERKAFREATERLNAHQQQRPAQQAASDDGKPKRDQFASEDAWLDARDAWRDRKREVESRQSREQEGARTLATKTDKLYAQAEKLAGFDADAFDEALGTPGLTGATARALIDSDVAPALMAHFASNAEDVKRIANLSPERQIAELGKLEVKLQAAPKTTKAPPPVGTVNGAGSGTPSLESADFATYKKLRAKQGAKWAS